MVKLEINDKAYKIPSSFDELDFEKYCKVFYKLPKIDGDGDDIEMFRRSSEVQSTILSRLLGEDDDFCMNLPLEVYGKLLKVIEYLFDTDYLQKNVRAGIVIDKKRYSIPPMNEMTLRQYIDADIVMQEEENDMQYIELLSILLTSKDKDGKWIPYNGNYQEMISKVKKLKCSEALPFVYHFFQKSHALQKLSQVSMKVAESQQHLSTKSS